MRPGSFLKFAFLLSVLAGMPVAHAVFPANNELSTPGTDSTDNGAGAVTDFKTGVMRKQCAEGLPAQTPVCDSRGEQYVHAATPAAGAHAYYFTASADDLNRFGQPASGAPSRPMANAQGADLIVSELSSESAGGSVPCGGTITIDDTVANQGNAETTAPSGFLVNYYLSNVSVSVLIGNRTISLLGVGSTDGATSTFTLPISLAPGVYQLSAVVDPNDVEPETNESNNTTVAAGSVTVVSNVDLLVTVLDSTPASVNVGGSITVSDTVANQGTTSTTYPLGFLVNYYLSNPSVSMLIGNRTIRSLGAGATNSASSTFGIPATLAPGSYQLSATVDPNNYQPETNETNNTLVAAGTVTVVRNVDLVSTAIGAISSSVKAGQNLTVIDTVKNQGTTVTTAVGGFRMTYYLSKDAIINVRDTMIGLRTISSLGAGASNTATSTFNIPANFAPGVYYLGVIVDSANTQVETNETNNTGVASGMVTVTP